MSPPSPHSSSPPPPTLYFGYGSNLWRHQMHLRCPKSHCVGIARLPKHRWIINSRGYANIVASETGSATKRRDSGFRDVVFGLVYQLAPTDEARLDENEGVPVAYTKEYFECDFWRDTADDGKIDTWMPPDETVKMLVYIDRKRVVPDQPRKEYVYRMNQGIADALRMGVPDKYVTEVMRKFIPAEEAGERNSSIEEFANGQAVQFKNESGVVW